MSNYLITSKEFVMGRPDYSKYRFVYFMGDHVLFDLDNMDVVDMDALFRNNELCYIGYEEDLDENIKTRESNGVRNLNIKSVKQSPMPLLRSIRPNVIYIRNDLLEADIEIDRSDACFKKAIQNFYERGSESLNYDPDFFI